MKTTLFSAAVIIMAIVVLFDVAGDKNDEIASLKAQVMELKSDKSRVVLGSDRWVRSCNSG